MAENIRRRPRGSVNSHVTERAAAQVKKFNADLRYVQGFRQALAASGAVPITITLNASGEQFLGFSIIPASGTNADIADCQITLSINNNNVLLNMSAPNANPNFVQGMMFFPIPQPLFGNDSIIMNITNNAATTPTILINIFYVPRQQANG